MKSITDERFRDLYIGPDYADVKNLNESRELIPVPSEFEEDIDALRQQCDEIRVQTNRPRFSIRRNESLYRVTCFDTTGGRPTFVIRQPRSEVMPWEKVDLGVKDKEFLMQKELRGAVIICGEMGSGKTTLASSLVVARLVMYGDIAVAIEDPPETALDGRHGSGRCIHVDPRGNVSGELENAVRSGASIIYLGEARDQDSTIPVISAANNGHFILSTTHASSEADAIMRLVNMCDGRYENAAHALASGLAAVIHVRLVAKKVNTPMGEKTIDKLEYSMLKVWKDPTVKGHIRSQNYHMLGQAGEQQKTASRAGE